MVLSGALPPRVNTRDLLHRLPATARLLIIRLRSMGDCLLLTSPLRALKEEFPGFSISVLVDARFADCLGGNPDVAEVLAVRGKASTIASLLARRFDLILNLHGGPTSSLFAASARGTRVGGEHYQYRALYSGTFPRPDPDRHTTVSTLDTFRWLGVRAASPPPLRFEHDPAAARRITDRLKTLAPSLFESGAAPAYLVMHPAALMETKRWAAERFVALGGWLQRQGYVVVLTCGPGEEPLVATVGSAMPGAVTMTGLSIPELAELIRGSGGYVGNDSGPMHLATAVGTRTLAIWGSSSAVRWHPWGVDHRVVQNAFACNPCPGYRCLVADSPLCIESVTVEQVQRAAGELFRSAGTNRKLLQ